MADASNGRTAPATEDLEVYSRDVNAWIVRTPGRKFPALVVQGDSFHQLFALAHDICARTEAVQDEELHRTAEKLRDILWSRLLHYEETIGRAGFSLPYDRIAWRPAK